MMSIESNKSEQKQENTTSQNECHVEVFSRVTGFYRPVQQWNPGKEEEFKDRKKFKRWEK